MSGRCHGTGVIREEILHTLMACSGVEVRRHPCPGCCDCEPWKSDALAHEDHDPGPSKTPIEWSHGLTVIPYPAPWPGPEDGE